MKLKFIFLISLASLLSASLIHAEDSIIIAKKNAVAAVMNARQLGLALFEFETEYGGYPSTGTQKDVEETAGIKLPKDDKTSNYLLLQLFAAKITENEKLFHAAIPGCAVADNVITPGEVLKKGENAFSYVAGLSTAGNPTRPLLLAPLIPGTTKFDPKPFNGKAIVLHIDNSVTTYEIQEDGRIYRDGIDLLSPKHPIWNGKIPDIRYPDL